MRQIRIGIESTATELHNQLLMHPERYFYILVVEGNIILCIQTCDKHGENTQQHEVDGLAYDSKDGLVSLFQEDLREAMMKRELFIKYLDGDRFPISSAIGRKIAEIPGLIEWIISSVLSNERCLMIYTP